MVFRENLLIKNILATETIPITRKVALYPKFEKPKSKSQVVIEQNTFIRPQHHHTLYPISIRKA
jgi:hypothetical protein